LPMLNFVVLDATCCAFAPVIMKVKQTIAMRLLTIVSIFFLTVSVEH